MAASSSNGWDDSNDDAIDDAIDDAFDDMFDERFDAKFDCIFNQLAEKKKNKKRAYIERQREESHNRLWNDYFSDDATYPPHIFRRRFRMTKDLFMHIVQRLSTEVPYFQQRRNAIGRLGLSPLQKCSAAIRMMANGTAADAVDEYLRLGASTALLCLKNFTEGIISLFGDEYLRRPTAADLRCLLEIGESRSFPGMIRSIDFFDDILHGRAPKVRYWVNGNEYRLPYYLTDGI
ncbi:uncharacterized protein LOC112089892 [Eutrema salsugineum]|uniref:uncharacterized protein LOC112089892 n=1 Tax=Eutrema salsugineum TaxID=72664 RepID=UPI000CED3434|nr:uncharacterized protein LOC112089892 [Eutrema salsugineum]